MITVSPMFSLSLQLYQNSSLWRLNLWVPRKEHNTPCLIPKLMFSPSLQLYQTSSLWCLDFVGPQERTYRSMSSPNIIGSLHNDIQFVEHRTVKHVTSCPLNSNAIGNIVWRKTQPQGMKTVSMTKQNQAPWAQMMHNSKKPFYVFGMFKNVHTQKSQKIHSQKTPKFILGQKQKTNVMKDI